MIIDDLDRIDPEHIFRILNVFAAHLDSKNDQLNKFGFDKIVLVCDIDNIRNIFKAKYGIKTDFNGYIDKYYSHKVFHYDIKNQMLRFAKKAFSVSKVTEGDLVSDDRSSGYYKDQIFSTFFNDVFTSLVDSGEIDLRNLIKWHDMNIKYHYYAYVDKTELNKEMHQILLGIAMLIDIKGGYSALVKAIEGIRLKSPLRSNYKRYCNDLAYIYLYIDHKGRYGSSVNPNRLSFTVNGSFSIFELIDGPQQIYQIGSPGGAKELTTDDFVDLFKKVVDMIESRQVELSG